jgi:hypothetical protein
MWASLGGERIISGNVQIPSYGIWTADLVLDNTVAIPTQTTLVVADLTLVANVYRMASFSGSRSALVVGGYGGWRKELVPKSYQQPGGISLSLVLGDAASEVGEKITVATDVRLREKFVREGEQAGRLLRQLAGSIWWMASDGMTHVGPRPTGAITQPFQAIDYSGSKGRIHVSAETLSEWLPGRSFTSPTITTARVISSVYHTLENDGKARTEVLAA